MKYLLALPSVPAKLPSWQLFWILQHQITTLECGVSAITFSNCTAQCVGVSFSQLQMLLYGYARHAFVHFCMTNSFGPPLFPAAAPPAVPERGSKESGQEAGNQRPEAAGQEGASPVAQGKHPGALCAVTGTLYSCV